MAERPNYMSPEDFRGAGHRAVDWVAGYHERIEEFPVLSEVAPGWVRSQLPAEPPEQGEDFADVLADLDRIVVPGLTHWQAPGFFGYFPANASGPAALGDLVSSGLGAVGLLWLTSPAVAELEQHMLDWLVSALELPERYRGNGVIQNSASSATLCAALAARERAGGIDALAELVAYTSEQAHSSVVKGLRIIGIPAERVRAIATTPDFAMRADHLAYEIVKDRSDGLTPFFVAATVGTTSTTAIDPVAEVGWVANNFEAWMHVDAAFAGSAAVCPEMRWLNDGLDTADSYVFNPHKWLLTNFDCSALYLADPRHLINAMSITPEYLRNEASDSGEVVDYRDWEIPLGRRFRALKLWFVMRHYGLEGLRSHIRRHVAWAAELTDWVAADDRFELVTPTVVSLVCFRHIDGDDATQRVLDAVNQSGQAFLTHTNLDDKLVIRVAIGSPQTERHHVEELWNLVQSAA
ncbi:pyridoxal-dependent decarboxylase [Candidatus Poriferisocius sp.]|uniref:pyridoxal-dependent decarboxylase n=1 Tax=Candidatus Poriferisocius sp. TaxID=3101276 RepID=UPI003B5B836D